MAKTITEQLLMLPEASKKRSLVIKNRINDQMISLSASTDKPTEVLSALKKAISIQLGVGNNLSGWLKNSYQPSLMQAATIARILGCRLDDLILIEDEKRN